MNRSPETVARWNKWVDWNKLQLAYRIVVEGIKRQHGRVRRNEPCPCKSGKKFKKCCLPLITHNRDDLREVAKRYDIDLRTLTNEETKISN